ncbi:DHH family phosphoesterase [Halovivax gelatinilyticus]|uniref:DHH family phosphoesterase n=1 Tax=Halovivax gelatinilyticus TaxID=2961597 RepID=UPI0020CA875A|nr:DHH family phosphoesterase [Halovivax gelatinilyticus]
MVPRLVLGCGDVGARLVEAVESTTCLVDDPETVERLRAGGIAAQRGDPTDQSTIASFDPPRSVLVAGDRTDRNVQSAEAAREAFPAARLTVYIGGNPTADARRRLDAVANDVVEPTRAIANWVLDRAASPEAETARRLRNVLTSIDGPLAVVTHDNPDPDAIASAVALVGLAESVGLEADACYYGEISHQENRAMVNLLDLDLVTLEASSDIDAYEAIALVDHSRPGINDGLPADADVDIVIDHHPPRGPVAGRFVDIRTIAGATSTVLTEYVERFQTGFDRKTATALLYGIRIDTNDFTRETTALDFRAAATLRPYVDRAMLERIEQPTIDAETFETIARAIKGRSTYDDVVVASAGRIASRDALPQAADRLLSMDGIRTTLVYGFMAEMVYLSARSRDRELDLGEVIRDAFEPIGSAGGHSDMAGAQLEIGVLGRVDDGDVHADAIVEAVEEVVEKRFIEAVESQPGTPVGSYTRESEVLFEADGV